MLGIDNLHPYQTTAVQHIIDNDQCGLFLEMGLGKTVSTLTAIMKLIDEELEVDKVLIVAPKRVTENVWTSEIKKWSHLKHLRTSRIIGSEIQRKRALAEEAEIYLISRDNIAWLCGLYGGSMLPFDMLVIDESSSFKSPKSIRFKMLRKVIESFKRRVILTGTPAPNGLLDLWAQVYLLDRGERLGKFITRYRENYFNPGKRNGAIIYSYNIKQMAESEIYERIGDICISMKAKDYLDLPGRINNYIDITLPKRILDKYEQFEEEQVLQLLEEEDDENDISTANAAALCGKLLQFANGAVYDEDKNVHEIHKYKLDALADIVEEAGGKPILVAYTFKHDLHRIEKRFKKLKPRRMEGDKTIEDWNAGKIQMLVMHPASGGHGLNLQQGGNIIVWFGQNWSLELYQQFNARLDRQGQKLVTIIHHLVSVGTIDSRVLKKLSDKDAKQSDMMDAVKYIIKKWKK